MKYEDLKMYLLVRKGMKRIGLVNDFPQLEAPDSMLWYVYRGDDLKYKLVNKKTNISLNQPHGGFLFVVRADEPHSIIAGKYEEFEDPDPSVYKDPNNYGVVVGHASISKRLPVLAIGELFFERGELIGWTNGSGHYKPDEKKMDANLTPYLKLTLPKCLFINRSKVHPN